VGLLFQFSDLQIFWFVWFLDLSDCLICRFSNSPDSLILLIPWFVWFTDSSDSLMSWFPGFSDSLILWFAGLSDSSDSSDSLILWFVWFSDLSDFLILLMTANQQSENQLTCYSGSLLLCPSDIQYFIQPAILCTVYQHCSDLQKVWYGICSDVSGVQEVRCGIWSDQLHLQEVSDEVCSDLQEVNDSSCSGEQVYSISISASTDIQ